MEISPKEVESVKTIGNLNGDDVKLVKTHGGFYVAVGRKKKNTKKAEALAAGSHQAIVNHQISKEFGQEFKPALFKSEHERMEQVEDYTNKLPDKHQADGVELYLLSKNNNLECVMCKYGATILKYDMEVRQDSLVLKNKHINADLLKSTERELSKSVSRVICSKMGDLNLNKLIQEYGN